jgi:hypothetical protein
MVFSDVTNNLGILQQTRTLMRVDANQWATFNVVNSCNNWLDRLAGYAIGADRKFQWDDTNHSKMPVGTTDLIADQREYSFLTDEQGNRILTLTRIDWQDENGLWTQLKPIDQVNIPMALDEFENVSSRPQYYDKVADNIIKLYPASDTSVTGGLKFYFQRTPSYFTADDTTKEPGFAPNLHRGFVISSAYDGALALGLPNLQPLSIELQKEEAKMIKYFSIRNLDERANIGVYQERKEQWR